MKRDLTKLYWYAVVSCLKLGADYIEDFIPA